MTSKEHLLVLTVIAKQTQLIKSLLDILKSRGIASADDARAFEFAAITDAASNAALFEREKAGYLRLAKAMGIETGLENLPPLSVDDFHR